MPHLKFETLRALQFLGFRFLFGKTRQRAIHPKFDKQHDIAARQPIVTHFGERSWVSVSALFHFISSFLYQLE